MSGGISSLYDMGAKAPLSHRGKAPRRSARLAPKIKARKGGYCLPNPRETAELALCRMPRGVTLAIGADDPALPGLLQAAHTLNRRGKVPALRFNTLRHYAREGDLQNSFVLITRLI